MNNISSLLVTHVEDPTGSSGSIFFWAVTAESSIFQQITKTLSSLKPQLDKACLVPKNLSGLTSGQIFLALVNRRWERAKLASSNQQFNPTSKLKVFCIDLGGEHLVSLDEVCLLSSLPPSFPVALTGTQALASRFIFADILPANGQWAKTVFSFLKTHLEKHSWLVTSLGSFNECCGVRIFKEHDRSSLFADSMISLGLARAADSYQNALCSLTNGPSLKPSTKKPLDQVRFKDSETVQSTTPLYNVLKIPPVELGYQEDVLVVHVEMGFFFGQLMKRKGQTLEALICELTFFYANESKPPLLYKNFDSRLGRLGVVKYRADGLFYRVHVTQELPNSDVEVTFIDYGNSEIVPRTEIFAPIAELKSFLQQPFGIRCSSPDLYSSRPEISKALIGKTIRVEVGPMITDDIYTVYLADNKDKKDVLETLLRAKEAAIVVKSKDNLSPLETEFNPSCQRQFSPELGQLLSPPRTPSVSSVTHDFLLSPVDSFALNAYPLQPLLNGATRILEVVYVKDPGDFYCQLADDFDALSEMMSKISKSYKSGTMPTLVSPKVGAPCMAQFLEDGQWYRGKVTDVNETEVDILFVDFGNTQRGPLDSVKAIAEEFVQLPPLAYHCELHFDESKKIIDWTLAEKKRFDAVTLDKEKMQAIFEKIDGSKYPVSLMSFEDDDEWVNINDLFIRLPSVPVKVASFSNVGKFYLSPKDQSPYVSPAQIAVLDSLNKYYTSLQANELIMPNPKVGTACVTRFTDQRFYRSKITAINGNMASVLFVDNGKSKEIPLSQLRQIEPRFLECPKLVWECHLKGVKPIEPSNSDHKSYLKDCFGTEEVIDAVLHPANQEGSFPVDLAVADVGDVSTYLLKLEVVKKEQPSTLVDVTAVVNDEPSVCESIALSKPKDMVKQVQISFIEPSGCFWIQLAGENKAVLEDLEAHLNVVDIEFNPNYQICASPVIDQCYAVLHPNSGKWQRGKIVSISGIDTEVFFIDYGDHRTVPSSSIRTLPPILKFIDPLAIRSQFNPVFYQRDEASDISSALKKICRPRQLCMAIASNWGENFLHIDSFETDKEIDVIHELVNSKLLIKKNK